MFDDWQISRAALKFINANKALWILVLLCMAGFIGITAAFFVDFYHSPPIIRPQAVILDDENFLTIVSSYYYCMATVGLFFTATLFRCISLRLAGQNGSIIDGLLMATKAFPIIAIWSLYCAFLGWPVRITIYFRDFFWNILARVFGVRSRYGDDKLITAHYFFMPVFIMKNLSFWKTTKFIQGVSVKAYEKSIGTGYTFYLLMGLLLWIIYYTMFHLEPYFGLLVSQIGTIVLSTVAVITFLFGIMISIIIRGVLYVSYIERKELAAFPLSVFNQFS